MPAKREPAKRASVTADQVNELRVELRDLGFDSEGVGYLKLRAVLERCGDIGVAADAILMRRRPGWLRDMIGV